MSDPDYKALCAELVELSAPTDSISQLTERLQKLDELANRTRAALARPEPAGVTDDEIDEETATLIPWLLEKAMQAADSDHPGAAGRLTLAAQLLGERRPTIQPPTDGEVAEVLQWPAEWSRKQRAQEAEMLCCSAGMTPGKEMQQLVRDARDGMPLQHLHDLISHAIPTPQPPVGGEVAELVGRLKELAHAVTKENWREFDMRVPAEPLRDADLVLTRAADLLQRQHPQPVPVSERLPGAEDCDGRGRCWLLYRSTSMNRRPAWSLVHRRSILDAPYSHWLPHWALPTPAIAAELGGP
jgi:hypothetical protein